MFFCIELGRNLAIEMYRKALFLLDTKELQCPDRSRDHSASSIGIDSFTIGGKNEILYLSISDQY